MSNKKGWYRESHRHSLARRGIKTKNRKMETDISGIIRATTYKTDNKETKKFEEELARDTFNKQIPDDFFDAVHTPGDIVYEKPGGDSKYTQMISELESLQEERRTMIENDEDVSQLDYQIDNLQYEIESHGEYIDEQLNKYRILLYERQRRLSERLNMPNPFAENDIKTQEAELRSLGFSDANLMKIRDDYMRENGFVEFNIGDYYLETPYPGEDSIIVGKIVKKRESDIPSYLSLVVEDVIVDGKKIDKESTSPVESDVVYDTRTNKSCGNRHTMYFANKWYDPRNNQIKLISEEEYKEYKKLGEELDSV